MHACADKYEVSYEVIIDNYSELLHMINERRVFDHEFLMWHHRKGY